MEGRLRAKIGPPRNSSTRTAGAPISPTGPSAHRGRVRGGSAAGAARGAVRRPVRDDVRPDTVQLCQELSDSFAELPKERIWGEFAKIALMARRPSMSLNALHEIGWERHFPELAAVRGVSQDPQWHPEGAVHVHLGLSADAAADAVEAAGLDAEDRMVVVLGAMVHDFGKATHTQTPDPSLAPTPGASNRITSHGHAEAGVEPAISFLRRIGAPERFATRIGPIVREHMAVAATADPTRPLQRCAG